MKRNQDRIRPNGSAASAARQPKTILLTLWRRSLSGERVRLQFVKVKTGRVLFSTVFQRGLLTIVERAAEKDGISVGAFIIKAIEWAFPRLEAKAAQGQGRVTA